MGQEEYHWAERQDAPHNPQTAGQRSADAHVDRAHRRQIHHGPGAACDQQRAGDARNHPVARHPGSHRDRGPPAARGVWLPPAGDRGCDTPPTNGRRWMPTNTPCCSTHRARTTSSPQKPDGPSAPGRQTYYFIVFYEAVLTEHDHLTHRSTSSSARTSWSPSTGVIRRTSAARWRAGRLPTALWGSRSAPGARSWTYRGRLLPSVMDQVADRVEDLEGNAIFDEVQTAGNRRASSR